MVQKSIISSINKAGGGLTLFRVYVIDNKPLVLVFTI